MARRLSFPGSFVTKNPRDGWRLPLICVGLHPLMKFILPAALLCLSGLPLHAAEVFEAALGRETELPGGKEADGIRGDFVLRSDKVEAVVSQNAPLRRANMSTFYGPDGVTPGCLFDLTLRGENNDQLICYGPVGHGEVSYVKTVAVKEEGAAAVESVTTAAKAGGVFKRNEYRVRDGIQGIFITSILRNESDKVQKVNTKADFTRFNETGEGDGIFWTSAVDPADKVGYAQVVLKREGNDFAATEIEIAPGKEVVIQRFLAIGRSPAEAAGIANEVRGQELGTLKGKVVSGGKPVTTGRVEVPLGKSKVHAFPDAKGEFSLKLAPGAFDITASDIGRPDAKQSITLAKDQTLNTTIEMAAASRVDFTITDDQGRSPPCKAMFEGVDGTPNPDLGPVMRAHGCKDQYHSEKGEFSVQLPAGKYRIRVVRGGEYSSLEQVVNLEQGKTAKFSGLLKRVLSTPGWITSDFHNHSTQSGDNICGTDDRVINIAAENLEWCPTTEHNRLSDWRPNMERLGLLEYFNTISGMELTGSRQHFNAFPFTPDRYLQDGGAPVWNDDPRITAITLRRHQGENPDRWIQFNHPDLTNMFRDRDSDGIADGGFVGVGTLIDGTETQNGNETAILEGAPFRISRSKTSLAAKATPVREFIWLQLLNQGHRLVALGVADAHAVYGNGVGGWHIYLKSPTDTPKELNWSDLAPHAKAGHIVVTNGPFLSVTTPDGKGPGDDARGTGGTTLHVQVQGTDWIAVDRIQVLVNGRPEPKLNFTRATHPQMFKDGVVQFEQKILVPLEQDAHLIVVALGENRNLIGGYGTSDQAKMHPCAYNNPIYVDIDGNGFQANGDPLGYDLPVAGITADRAKELLQRAGQASEAPSVPKPDGTPMKK